MAGCRDCNTCTKPGLSRWTQNSAAWLGHVSTGGISLLVKRATRRHCPQCRHITANHARRADGSYID